MKKFSLFLLLIFLITAASSFQQVTAQEKTKDEQDKDSKIQKSIDEQKKAINDQKKANAEAVQIMKMRIDSLNSPMDEKMELENLDRVRNKFQDRFVFDEPFITPDGNFHDIFRHSMGGDAERTSWEFSKTVKDNTFSNNYSFDVDKTSRSVVMTVMGDCKSGEIRVKIVMPDGKNYSDIVIDESGNLNWRKSFNISETENQDKTGDWKFQISSTKATGYFKISLQAF
jgi:ATPase subunit of ABC transporter with duplicated ATPase domains